MKYKILFVPIDDRPCTYKMPVRMGKIAQAEVIAPPTNILGCFKRQGDSDRILDWLKNIEGKFDGAIISTDMIIYGGLVSSRIHKISKDTAKTRLREFLEILDKKREQFGTIYLFSSLLRVMPTVTDDALIPKLERIVSFSCESYHAQKGDKNSQKNLEKIKQDIPEKMLEDYLKTRNRNFSINKSLVEEAGKGFFDYLLIGIDDSKTTGLNILEKEELENAVDSYRLKDNVSIATGTDEMAALLISRLLAERTGIHPTMHPIYSNTEGKDKVGRYEDRSFEKIIKLHTKIAGGYCCNTRKEADILLYIHNPAGNQKEAASQKFDILGRKNLLNFIHSINKSIDKGRNTALADVFYANGSDNLLMGKLVENVNVFDLLGFAGWNTAGNTLGTTISYAIINYIARKNSQEENERQEILSAHAALMLERLIDDWLYQSEIRQQISLQAMMKRVSVFNLGDMFEYFQTITNDKLNSRSISLLQNLKGLPLRFSVEEDGLRFTPPNKVYVSLPWQRLFEVSVDFDESEKMVRL